MQKNLIIETASSISCIAICNNSTVEKSILIEKNQTSKTLLSLINSLSDVKEIGYIGLGIGPGSYTGLRIGATVAKSLSYVLEIPIIPFYSLLSFIPSHDGTFISALDARSQGFYLLKGEKNGSLITVLEEPHLSSNEDSLLQFQKVDWIVSPEIDSIQKKVDSTNLPLEQKNPDPQFLASLVYKTYENQTDFNLNKIQLLYLDRTLQKSC